MEKRKEEDEAEEAVTTAEEKANEEDATVAAAAAASSSTSFPEDELQNALMSSLEGKKCLERRHEDNAATTTTSPPSLPSSPRVDEEGEEESELTDKGYTLTDDDVSDKGGADRRIIADRMSVSMFVTSTESDAASMTASTISWSDVLECEESANSETRDLFKEQPVTNEASTSSSSASGQSEQLLESPSRAVGCISEDSGLSDSKTSDPYDPYKGKKKRKQRPRVKSMIEI